MSIDCSVEALETGVVPITRQLLPEMDTIEDVSASLAEVIDSTVPAFVIRAATLDDSQFKEKEALEDFILSELIKSGHYFAATTRFVDVAKIRGRARTGAGELHVDKRAKEIGEAGKEVKELDIHSTITGRGSVYMANSAPSFLNVTKEEYDKMWPVFDELLACGFVNPNYIEPVIYGARIKYGDHVVFAQNNKHGSVWHRFDTESGPRKASVTLLERTSRDEALVAQTNKAVMAL